MKYEFAILIMLLFSSCATVQRAGYLDGITDSGVFNVESTDTAKERKIKVTAQKVVEIAKQEIKSIEITADKATADAAEKMRGWKNTALIIASFGIVLVGYYFIRMVKK
jgi:hypothetical protein